LNRDQASANELATTALLAARSASADDGAEIPVRQEEQVLASHGHRLSSECSA
jgi:hypothetical protein